MGFYKFTTEGQVFEGIWRGTRQGKYGDNGQVELPDGSIVQFTLNGTLRDLVKVPDGTEVRITYPYEADSAHRIARSRAYWTTTSIFQEEGLAIGALKRWKNIGGGQGGGFYKFTTEGQVLEGIWRGTRQGKYGDNGQVELPDGNIVQFTLNVTLRDLVKVPDGTEVRITYRGMARAKNGNEFKAFTIQVEEGAEVSDDDEVPF